MTYIDEQLDEEDEERVRRLMREATRDIVAPVDELVREGRRRGASMRRRRLAAQLAGVCVCTGVVIGGVALARPLIVSPTSSDQAVVADQATHSAAPDATRSRFAVATTEMATTLASLLPAGGRTQNLRTWASGDAEEGSGPEVAGTGEQLGSLDSGDVSAFRAGSVVFDDGAGLAAVSVIVSAPDPTRPSAVADDLEALCAQGAADCTDVPAGRLVVLEGVSEAARGGTDGLISNNAVLVTPDGYSINVTAYNAAAEKDSDPTRSRPPVTGEQLGSIATDQGWLS